MIRVTTMTFYADNISQTVIHHFIQHRGKLCARATTGIGEVLDYYDIFIWQLLRAAK